MTDRAMTDRVKYFLLGLLFLVVAGVIAFDRWNSREAFMGHTDTARENTNSGETWVNPVLNNKGRRTDGRKLSIDDRNDDGPVSPHRLPDPDGPKVDPIPKPPSDPNDGRKPEPKPVVRADKTHVVKSGETLEAISRQYYPGKIYAGIKLIAHANKIENLNRITERQKLVIPAMDTRVVRKAQVTRVDTSKKVPNSYTVKANDGDLYTICRRYYGRTGEGRRVKEIMSLNGLLSAYVTAGTVIKLPPR